MTLNSGTEPNALRRGMILRRVDQATVAVLLAAGLALLAWHWLHQRYRNGQMLHFERVDPTAVPLQIDINRADWPELTLLPDVGETLARRIVQDRAEHGPFRNAADLQRVAGIGPRTLQRLQPFVHHGGQPSPVPAERTPRQARTD